MVEANAWKNAVLSIVIEEKITTQNIADIQGVVLGLNEIKDNNLDMYTVISTSGSTYGYAEFQVLINAVEYLFGDIAQLANDMAGLSTDLSVIVAEQLKMQLLISMRLTIPLKQNISRQKLQVTRAHTIIT